MKRGEFEEMLKETIEFMIGDKRSSYDIASYITFLLQSQSLITLDDVTLDDEDTIKHKTLNEIYIDKLCERLVEFTDLDEYTIANTFLDAQDIDVFMEAMTEGENARYAYEVFKRIEDIADDYVMAKKAQLKTV